MDTAISTPILVAAVAALIAAGTDLRTFKIHNLLTLPLLATGLAYHGFTGGGEAVQSSLLGILFAFGVLIIPYMAGGMGAGDVKLLAGIGAWVGMPNVLNIFLASSIAAGIYAILLMFVHGRLRETWANLRLIWLRLSTVGKHLHGEDRVETQVKRDDRRQRLIPFAAMVAVGVLTNIVLMSLQ